MAEKSEKTRVGSSTIAYYFGMTAKNVQLLTKNGIIPGEKVGNYYKYDLDETIQTYIQYLTKKAHGREAASSESSKGRKEEAEADLKRVKADIAALQLKELEGKMHRSEDVEAVITDLVYLIRSMLIALPGRLAVDAAQAQTAAEASVFIRKEVYKILEELADYQYDPEEFAKRVREREGWIQTEIEEEDD